MVDPLRVGAVWEAGADQCAIERELLADADAPPVELRAVAARGREKLLSHRVVDHGVLETAAHLDGDRDRERRETVQEVRRAVERVDDPGHVAAATAAGFLAEEAVLGVDPTHRLDDVALGHLVDFGDEVVAALGLHGQRRHPVDVPHDEVSRATRSADGNVEQWLHGHAAAGLGGRGRVGKSGGGTPPEAARIAEHVHPNRPGRHFAPR